MAMVLTYSEMGTKDVNGVSVYGFALDSFGIKKGKFSS